MKKEEALLINQLDERLKKFESEFEIRACMNRYMYLCDNLNVGFNINELISLFSEKSIWEGIGDRYSQTFGRIEGLESIKSMFEKYIKPPGHFVTNVHFLSNELIIVHGNEAKATWILLQTSTYIDGRSQLSSARLNVDFIREYNIWKIKHFRTESLFNRPVNTPWEQSSPVTTPQ